MKKILYGLFLLTLLLSPIVTKAASFSFSPSANTVAPGETFSVNVFVTPEVGEEITVAKLSVNFPANILEVVSFSQSNGWMSPTAGEFDSVDNSAGTFDKMAGYPARVTTSTQFGTVTFKAKIDGVAIVKAGEGSIILDTSNSNKYTISSGATFSVVTPTVKAVTKEVTKEIKPVTTQTDSTTKEMVSEEGSETEGTTVEEDEINPSNPNLALVAEAGNSPLTTKNIFFILIFVALLIFGIYFFKKKS